jgi:hypothetical protein
VYWPTLIDSSLLTHEVIIGAESTFVAPTPGKDLGSDLGHSLGMSLGMKEGETTEVALGRIAGARSGDKGGNANLGVWVRTDEQWSWLRGYLSIDTLRDLMPETEGLEIARYEFPLIRAINFVIVGLLGEGVASSTRIDPQAKSLGEYLRAKYVDVPLSLLVDLSNPKA